MNSKILQLVPQLLFFPQPFSDFEVLDWMKHPKEKRRTRQPADASKEAILRHALFLMARHGYEGMTIQGIADRCRVSQSNVLYHFPSKAILVKALIERIVRHNHQIVSEKNDENRGPLARLRGHFAANLDWAVDFPDEGMVIFLLYMLAVQNKAFSSFYETILQNARLRIRTLLEEAIRVGEISHLSQLDMRAELLHDGLIGGVINAVTVKSKKPDKKAILAKWDVLIREVLK